VFLKAVDVPLVSIIVGRRHWPGVIDAVLDVVIEEPVIGLSWVSA
jgi:hypothetical protein